MNQIYCNICRRQSDAFSFNKLYNCPEVLTIILNRGKGLEFDVEFKFPFSINIDKYVIDKSCDTNYELIGVLTHLGPSGMSGHFIAYCKSPVNKKWYRYNDAQVTQCSDVENEIKTNGIPYVLYYQRYQNLTLPDIKNEEGPSDNTKNNNKNIKNEFVLYFKYGEKEGYIELTGTEIFYDIANKIKEKNELIPKGANNFYLMKDNNMLTIDIYKGLQENGIKNGDKIWIIEEN